ncbi:MAG: tetratricopeptide repeat protein [Saprospiraceae bacterium]|nr:tetratricopeptide repeat protein [Saprospiraceae bacterium]
MKTSHILVFYCLAIILVLFGCAGVDSQPPGEKDETMATDTDPWPQLLVRNDALSGAPEWEATVAAVNQASSALISNPEDAAALLKLAKIYTNEARVTGEHGYYYPAILDLIDRALACRTISGEQRLDAYGLRANTLLSQHRFADALEAAEYAVSLNPDKPSAYAALVDACVEMGHYEAALEHAQTLLNMRPDLVSYARASYLREIHGDIDGAIEAMKMAVNAGYPGRENAEWARITLAEMLARYDDPVLAERLYREALEVRDNYPFALAGLAALHLDAGRYADAESYYLRAIEVIPEFSFQEGLLQVYLATGRTSEAQEAYAELLAMLEDDMDHGHIMNMEYAEVLLTYGDAPEKALPFVLKEYQERPENIDVNLLLAEIYAALDQPAKARAHLEAAQVTGSQNPELLTLSQTLAMLQ